MNKLAWKIIRKPLLGPLSRCYKKLCFVENLAENAKEAAQDSTFNQHMLVCAFQEMGCLLVSLGTTASSILLDSQSGPVTTAFAVLVHPCQAARLAAAWCLRCVCVASPSQTTPVIDKYNEIILPGWCILLY